MTTVLYLRRKVKPFGNIRQKARTKGGVLFTESKHGTILNHWFVDKRGVINNLVKVNNKYYSTNSIIIKEREN